MNIEIIDIPTEQTTAATDALIAVMAARIAFCLRRRRRRDPWKVDLWTWTFGLLTLSGALGAAAHGFKMSPATNAALWQPLNLSLGMVVALFVVGAIHDLWGRAASRRALPAMIVAGGLFFGVTQAFPGIFAVFIVYEALAMLFALGVYGKLAFGGRLPGAYLMLTGILISIIAAAVQSSSLAAKFIWQFDHNGLFHLIQMVGLPVLAAGLYAALRDSPSVRGDAANPASGAA